MQSRPLRDFERGAHLHVLDWAHQTARLRFQAAGAVQVKAAAKAYAGESDLTQGPSELPSLQAALLAELQKLYALGHGTVRSELDHQLSGEGLPVGLSAMEMSSAVLLAAGERGSDQGRLRARATLAAQAVAHAIWQAIQRARLQGVTGRAALRQAGRAAGTSALRGQASHHAGGAINSGRHAAALRVIPGGGEGGPAAQIIGARYTSVLDKSSCGPCEDADDGVLRSLDDPGLVHPPNPACLGGDRCRCILVYQLGSEVGSLPVPIAAGA